jgi:hypothetical protein
LAHIWQKPRTFCYGVSVSLRRGLATWSFAWRPGSRSRQGIPSRTATFAGASVASVPGACAGVSARRTARCVFSEYICARCYPDLREGWILRGRPWNLQSKRCARMVGNRWVRAHASQALESTIAVFRNNPALAMELEASTSLTWGNFGEGLTFKMQENCHWEIIA